MESIPFFTIVIPLFNKKEHVCRALDSVFEQTVSDWELIVVNDGSTDGGEKLINNYNDFRIKLINQNNQGVSAARNKGIQTARGKYIAFLDADDKWMPGFLETILSLIKKFPFAGIYATRYSVILEDGGQVFQETNGNKSLDNNFDSYEINYFKEALVFPIVWSSAVCVPKEIFMEFGMFKVGEKYGEDIDMWGRIALQKNVAMSDKQCANYFKNAENRVGSLKNARNEPFFESVNSALQNELIREDVKEDLFKYLEKVLITKTKYHIINGFSLFAREFLLKNKRFINKKSFAFLLSLTFVPLPLIRYAVNLKSIKS